MSVPILEVRNLKVEYATPYGPACAVDDVSFHLAEGEFLAIVGESGCGKSTLLFAIAQLLSPPAEIVSGSVLFNGVNMTNLSEEELRSLRWKDISVVMQSAMNALNPILTIGAQLTDTCRAHTDWTQAQIQDRSLEVLSMVSIDPVHLNSYAFQLSGGMRQRAMIAMALLLNPKLIIMDEPTSALDVVAQRSLMSQIQVLRKKLGFSVIFVTHDMNVVSHFSDRLAVMYAGQIVEIGATEEVFLRPKHPYSMGLMDAFPALIGERKDLVGIPGNPPSLVIKLPGCSFAPRCEKVQAICSVETPPLNDAKSNLSRCHFIDFGNGHSQ